MRSRRSAWRPALACATALCALSLKVHAAATTGIAVDRLAPAPGPSAFVQVEGAAVAPAGQLWTAAALSTLARPLVLLNSFTGEVAGVPVQTRVTLDLGAEVGIWRKRLALGFGMPVVLWQDGDRLQRTGAGASVDPNDASAPLKPTVVGDLRFRGKALLTAPDRPLGLALVLEVTVPAGGQAHFAATSAVTVAPRLLGSLRRGRVAAAINAGLRVAPQRALYMSQLHNSFEWGAAIGVDVLARRVGLSLIGEAVGAVNLVAASPLHSEELRGALRLSFWQGAVDVVGGGGFGSMAPAWRALVVYRGWFGRRSGNGQTCAVAPDSVL